MTGHFQSVFSLGLLCGYVTLSASIAYPSIKLEEAKEIIYRHAIIYIVHKINMYNYVNIYYCIFN